MVGPRQERDHSSSWLLALAPDLIAPFAFLGPAYDKKLNELYTSISFKDIAKKRSIFSIVTNDAMADNTPLKHLVKKHINQNVLEAIAAEYAKGRMLLIGTVNLDARRPVIWNITEIAASHRPEALELTVASDRLIGYSCHVSPSDDQRRGGRQKVPGDAC